MTIEIYHCLLNNTLCKSLKATHSLAIELLYSLHSYAIALHQNTLDFLVSDQGFEQLFLLVCRNAVSCVKSVSHLYPPKVGKCRFNCSLGIIEHLAKRGQDIAVVPSFYQAAVRKPVKPGIILLSSKCHLSTKDVTCRSVALCD